MEAPLLFSDERVLLGQSVVLIDIPSYLVSERTLFDSAVAARIHLLGLPRVADPHIVGRDRGVVTTRLHHIRGQRTLLRLVLVLRGRKNK